MIDRFPPRLSDTRRRPDDTGIRDKDPQLGDHTMDRLTGMLYCRCEPGERPTVGLCDGNTNIRLRVPRVIPTVEIIMKVDDAMHLGCDLITAAATKGATNDSDMQCEPDRMGDDMPGGPGVLRDDPGQLSEGT